MEKKEFRNKSYIETDCEEGVLFSAWTQKWGLKVTTWYGMDRLRFSFIEKGASGKGQSFDVHVNCMKNYAFDFEDFKHEVLHDIRTPYDFVTVMQKEKAAGEKYPKRYKFVTGSNGEKSVGIANASNGSGYVINGSSMVNGKRAYANIPVSYYDIYDIVSAYDRTYGKRREALETVLMTGIRKSEEEHSRYHAQEYEPDPETPVPEGQVKPEPAEAPAPDRAGEGSQGHGIRVTTVSSIKIGDDGSAIFRAITEEGVETAIKIPKDAIEAMNSRNGLFDKFKKKVDETSTEFKFSGVKTRMEDGEYGYVFASFLK